MKPKYECDVLLSGFGIDSDSDVGYTSTEYLPDHRVLVTGNKFSRNARMELKTQPVVVDTVWDMAALELGRRILNHIKEGE